jgi:hypothetical protein
LQHWKTRQQFFGCFVGSTLFRKLGFEMPSTTIAYPLAGAMSAR